MAYNPFNIFRRNQKAIFAVLTVFIMIMFTLSSGVVGGDFFETFTNWLGSKSRKGDALCTIDGTKVYDGELQKLQLNRRMANQYMGLLALTTANQLDTSVNEQLGRLSPDAHQIISGIIEYERQLPNLARNPARARQIPDDLRNIRRALQRIIDSPTATAEDKDAARTKLGKFILMESLGQGDQYFRFAPNRTLRDRIDFVLWQKKADQLGIRFTEDDVGRLIRREVFNKASDEVLAAVRKQMSAEMQNFSMSVCLKALGEEFRVRAAQSAILGPVAHGGRGDKTDGDMPVFNPPFEAFEFYRDTCSPTSYAAIPVPAANLLAEVERRLALPPGHPDKIAEPTEKELLDLFDAHKDAMYSPDRDTPAFKIPPRFRLEWFQITGDEPYYKAEAEKAVRNELVQANLSAVLNVQAFGPTPVAVAFDAKPFVEDPLLSRRYAETVRRHNDDIALRYSSADVNLTSGLQKPLQSSVVRPGVPAVAVGSMGGQLAGLGNPLAGVVGTVSGPMAYEIRDRVRVGMPAVLGTIPVPGLFNTAMGGAAASQAMLPKPLSIEAYRGEFLQTLKDEKAKEIAFGNMARFGGDRGDVNKFIEEVAKLSEKGRARDMTAARKYIEDFLAQRALRHADAFAAVIGPAGVADYVSRHGLPRGETKQPRTEWNLEDDPGVAPLVAAHKESLFDPSSPHQGGYTPFGQSFFEFNFMTGGVRSMSGIYMAQQYPPGAMFGSSSSKSRFVVWRSEEVAATTPGWDDSTKAVVRDVWKRMKARELAKAKAEGIANGIRNHAQAIGGGPGGLNEFNLIPYLRDEAEKLRAAAPGDTKAQRAALPFPIRGVCPLTSQTGNPAGETGLPSFGPFDRPAFPGQVRRFQLPPSENIKYPTNEFGNAIMDERTKPAGTVLVLTDAPKDTYYVVTLVKRDEKTENDYLTQVASGILSDRMGGREIMAEFQTDAFVKARDSINALLKHEFKYDETEEQKKRLDEDEKRGGDN